MELGKVRMFPMRSPGHRKPKNKILWVLGAGGGMLLLGAVFFAVFAPIWVVRWLGGEDFRRLASGKVSEVLKTQGNLAPLHWSSFAVYSANFLSEKEAPGPWTWDIQEIRTEISPRLLLDRILRFSEISIRSVTLTSNPSSRNVQPEKATPSPTNTVAQGPDLFRDVEVGKIEIGNFTLPPSNLTQGWGVQGVQIAAFPTKQTTDFHLQKGVLLTPFAALGVIQLQQMKGRFVSPTAYITELSVKSEAGGQLMASGEYTLGTPPSLRGQFHWDQWTIPGQLFGLGMYTMRGECAGEFTLDEWQDKGARGRGRRPRSACWSSAWRHMA